MAGHFDNPPKGGFDSGKNYMPQTGNIIAEEHDAFRFLLLPALPMTFDRREP